MINTSIIAAFVVSVLTYYIFNYWRVVKDYIQLCYALRQIQGAKPHWLRGDILPLYKGVGVEQYEYDMKNFRHYRRRWLGPFLGGITVYDPILAQNVANNFYNKTAYGYRILKAFMGESLVTGNGAKWKHDRKMLNPVFHTSALLSYIQVFNKAVRTLNDKLSNEQRILTMHTFSKLALNNIIQCALSIEEDDEDLDEYRNAVVTMCEIFLTRASKLYYLFEWTFRRTALYTKQLRCLNVLHSHAVRVISQRRKLLTPNQQLSKTKRTDFLDILLNSVNMNGDELSDDEILFHIHTFMIAGHETTGGTLTWLFYFLAKHQEHQDKCREEINQVLNNREEVTWEDAQKLNYLTMCIKETLRIRSPAYMFAREISSSMKANEIVGSDSGCKKNVTLPKGTFLQVNLYNLHHNPEVWENPEEFNPCRFEKANVEERHPFSFMPFAAGPRNCIGQHFAMLEMKVTAAVLLKNKMFSIGNDFVDPGLKIDIVLRPDADFHLEVANYK